MPQARLASPIASSRPRSKRSSRIRAAIDLVDIAERQAEGVAQPRLDALARPERGHRLGRPGAGLEEAPRRRPRRACRLSAWRSRISGQVALPPRRATSISASVARASNCSSRPSSGRKPGASPASDGKGGEQALGEGVDGLDAQAAAGRLEHAGEQGAGPRAGLRPRILAERDQLMAEIGVLEPHPISEPRMDPPGHLGRARLGEGEAEDRGRIDAGEQQPQHPRGEDMGLAGPRRGRQRGMVARMRGAQLVAFEDGEGAEAIGHGGTLAPGTRPVTCRARQKMNAPAMKAAIAIIQSRGCMALISISILLRS